MKPWGITAVKRARFLQLLLFSLLLAQPLTAGARGHHHHSGHGGGQVAVFQLPPEARATLQRIRQGGPFPYARDGIVFHNYEHRLPRQLRGYYHEYTVKTPFVHGRGARRIICGPPPECYYSSDHYRSFRRITGKW